MAAEMRTLVAHLDVTMHDTLEVQVSQSLQQASCEAYCSTWWYTAIRQTGGNELV